jgi:hypothetical protein
MGALIHVVLFAAALMAFIAWAVAVLNALNITSLAPPGEKLSTYFKLGMWRFTEIEARLGPAVKPHLKRYKRAFFVFFAVIGAIMALAITFTFVKTA